MASPSFLAAPSIPTRKMPRAKHPLAVAQRKAVPLNPALTSLVPHIPMTPRMRVPCQMLHDGLAHTRIYASA
eukprot:14530967-Alexandrium_andersonii.AAC.1